MGCSCGGAVQAQEAQEAPPAWRKVSEVASEPIVAVYEDDSSQEPSVFGCGAATCSPYQGGTPTALRVERFSARGVLPPAGQDHVPTEVALPEELQALYASAHCASGACLPWVRVERDPNTFAKRLAAARAIGPIKNSRQVYDMLRREGMAQDQEVFYVLLLDIHNKIRGVGEIARGARDRVQTPIPDILRLPLVDGAAGFIVAHNHPTGDVRPSTADKQITKVIEQAAQQVGVPLFDHIILGADRYFSFFDRKLIS